MAAGSKRWMVAPALMGLGAMTIAGLLLFSATNNGLLVLFSPGALADYSVVMVPLSWGCVTVLAAQAGVASSVRGAIEYALLAGALWKHYLLPYIWVTKNPIATAVRHWRVLSSGMAHGAGDMASAATSWTRPSHTP